MRIISDKESDHQENFHEGLTGSRYTVQCGLIADRLLQGNNAIRFINLHRTLGEHLDTKN